LHFPLSLCVSWFSDRRTLCRLCGASVLYATPLKAPAERQIVYRHYSTANGVDLRLNHSPGARRRRISISSLQNLHSRNFCTARTTNSALGHDAVWVSPPAPVGTHSRIECPSCAVHSFTSSRMLVYPTRAGFGPLARLSGHAHHHDPPSGDHGVAGGSLCGNNSRVGFLDLNVFQKVNRQLAQAPGPSQSSIGSDARWCFLAHVRQIGGVLYGANGACCAVPFVLELRFGFGFGFVADCLLLCNVGGSDWRALAAWRRHRFIAIAGASDV
ncbi:hypothetical protein BJ912DRAFT_984985, partial [Pholiota molesta]